MKLLAPFLALTVAAFAQTEIAPPQITRYATGQVVLACDTPGAQIRYTLDDSAPNAKSGPYLAPLTLPADVAHHIRAAAFSPDRKTQSPAAELRVEATAISSSPTPRTLIGCTQDRDWPTYDWAVRHAAVSAFAKEHHSPLVFIGDSITQMFGGEPHDRPQPGREVWDKFYTKRNAANLGFGYDYVENTLWRLQHGELDGAAAKAIVLLIGTNNTGKDSAADIYLGIHAILTEIHRVQPGTRILLLAILPRGQKPDGTRTKIAEINTALAQLDGQNGITFLDAGAAFLQPDGTIPKELMNDFLHPTAAGYELLAAAMETTLQKMLGE